jgi:uncharacterized oxidoreductase
MIVSQEKIHEIGIRLFTACGASPEHAEIVIRELIIASLMGLNSHGIMRILQYLQQVEEGQIKPDAPIQTIFETEVSAIVDCNWNFGMVCASKMTEIVYEKASVHYIACAASRHCNHIGRLGAYTQMLAEKGMFAYAVTNSSRHGHFVSPFGGIDGRLATNPISYAVPAFPNPIVFDMSTSMIAEGKIRFLRDKGEYLPGGYILDSFGNVTNDPNEFYGPPRGTILPFGGEQGYKGFGLSLMVEILGSALSGVALTPENEKDQYINGFFILAIHPALFGADQVFAKNIEVLKNYILSSRPRKGTRGPMMPGELDFENIVKNKTQGLEIPDSVMDGILTIAYKKYGFRFEPI